MRPLPIRWRLMSWYFAVLALTFVLFAWTAFREMRQSLLAAVDGELHDRVEGFHDLLSREKSTDFRAELLQHSGSSDLFEMKDASGNWVYRSPGMIGLGLDTPSSSVGSVQIESIRVNGAPFRVLNTKVLIGKEEYVVVTAVPLSRYEKAVRRFGIAMLVATPLVLLLGALGGFWISRKALQPIDQMTQEAQAINAQRLSRRVANPQTGDELQRLSETLNAMLERLEQSFARINQFTADASHELRTPVAYMRTVAEIALHNPRNEAEYKQALSDIATELEKTTTLLESLLFLARADSGYSLPSERLDVREPIRQAAAQAEVLAESKHLTVQSVVPESPLWIVGDQQSLERMLLVLLDNAVKYTPDGGRIGVDAKATDGHAIIEVTDTGIGIAEADRSRIFDRFYRADKARARESGGAGLGLSIARWIAHVHGGEIAVRSEVAQGSTFSVRLPLFPTKGA